MSAIRIPDGFLDELKARLRPSDIIGRKVKLKKQGKEWAGLSPFTNEKTPSFYVNDQKKIFKCFSSGIGGDVIKFVQETERLSFMEAVEKLAEEAGMTLPKASPEARETYDRHQRLLAACKAATAFYEASLHADEGRQARQYLQGRGLTTAAWPRYRLGYAPDDWRRTFDHLRAEGFTTKEIVDAGICIDKGDGSAPYDRFRGRVIFPIADPQGRIIAFGGRGLAPEAKPKYLNSSDTPLFSKGDVLYRYKAAREALGHGAGGGLIVCEGYMDVIALCEAGFTHAVAPLGTALTERQLGLLWRAGPEPLLCFDGDAAGVRAAHRSIDRALPHLEPGRSLFFCLLGEGLDPDDLIKTKGRAAMAEALDGALPLAEVLWRRERDLTPSDTPERKAGLEQRLRAAAAEIRHNGVKAAYERDLRQRMNDHFWQQRQASRPPKGAGLRGSTRAMGEAGQTLRPAKVRGLGLVVRAIDCPALLERGGEELAGAHFADPDVSLLRDTVFDLIDSDTDLDRGGVRDHVGKLGKARAAKLLDDYPTAPPIDPDGAEAREWLIALEQFAAQEEPKDGAVSPAGMDATKSMEAWKRAHKKVAESRAMRARMNEAAEEADRS